MYSVHKNVESEFILTLAHSQILMNLIQISSTNFNANVDANAHSQYCFLSGSQTERTMKNRRQSDRVTINVNQTNIIDNNLISSCIEREDVLKDALVFSFRSQQTPIC